MRRVAVVILVVLTAAATWAVTVAPPAGAVGESWTLRNAPDSSWQAITVGGGSVVAVADSGADRVGLSFVSQYQLATAAENNAWKSVVYGQAHDRFVAVASDGTNRVMTSDDDGVTWQARNAPANAWSSVAWSPVKELYVAVATDGTNRVMTSPNGVTWAEHAAAAANSWTSVTWIGGGVDKFVAVSSDGLNRVMVSEDGETWVLSNDATVTDGGAWTSVATDGTTLVAVASSGADRVMTSANGLDWELEATAEANNWNSVASDGAGAFVAVASSGTNRVMVSSNGGQTWSPHPAAAQNSWTAVAWAGGILGFVAVSADGTQRSMRSLDGTSWTAMPRDTFDWSGVTFGEGLFVAVASSGSIHRVMTSPDGVTWTPRAAAEPNQWNSVAFGGGQFVAVAADGTNQVMTSDDGISWVPQSAQAEEWRSVTYGGGRFVAVSRTGGDRVMWSSDGVNWSPSGDTDTAAGEWNSVTYGNGRFVAVRSGATDSVMSSTNGVDWALHDAPSSRFWSAVTYGGGRFVAVAAAGGPGDQVMTSTNGTAWTLSGDATTTDDSWWGSVTYGGGTFVALGALVGTNRVMTSTDGLEWASYTVPQNNIWMGVTYSSGVFVAVAQDGINPIMTSGTFALVPTITSFDPTSGTIGTVVTITGTNFTGATEVLFDGAASESFTVVSPTRIDAVVPPGATTGEIQVTTPGGTAVSEDEFVVNSGAIRLAGQDELDTAIDISQTAFPTLDSAVAAEELDGGVTDNATVASAVVLARNDFFADALTGGPLAATVNGPMLLTYGAPTPGGATLPAKVSNEIDRLIDPGDVVYILGGTLAVSQGVEDALDADGYVVHRLWGQDQFVTALAIANQIEDLDPPSTIFEATGFNFPDALSAVPAAIDNDGVILLTEDNVQSPWTQAWINTHPSLPRYAIGGPLVAAGADPGATPVWGQDLFDTSAEVAEQFFPDPGEVGIATGTNFPDALSGGVFMATGGRLGPMLLVQRNIPLPPAIDAYLETVDVGTIAYIFGGTLAVSSGVVNAVLDAING